MRTLITMLIALGILGAAGYGFCRPTTETMELTLERMVRPTTLTSSGIGLSGEVILHTDRGELRVPEGRRVHRLRIGQRYRLEVERSPLSPARLTVTGDPEPLPQVLLAANFD